MSTPVIEVTNLVRRYGKTEAVNGLTLSVPRGRCYGFFGRNGAGKTTTIKCLINLLRPSSGSVRIFGLDPAANEVGVKSRLSYVPDQIGVYPWMTVRGYFEYLASFRARWNARLQADLLEQFSLDPGKRANALSKGERVQMALIGALCPEPELLVLDEPTSGLDPLIRREFIRTVIGAYQDGDPEGRTVFVSTHLITEFEGLIDEFTIIEQGRAVLSMPSEEARAQFHRLRARFPGDPPHLEHPNIREARAEGRELELIVRGDAGPIKALLAAQQPEEMQIGALTLEEIFLATVKPRNGRILSLTS
jgi:ABC-2 type transport system ATP-binding protein